MSVQDQVIADLVAERQFAIDNGFDKNDAVNTRNDWIGFANVYLGRAVEGSYRNEVEKQDYRANLVKAGGIILSALVAYDRAENRATLGTSESLAKE